MLESQEIVSFDALLDMQGEKEQKGEGLKNLTTGLSVHRVPLTPNVPPQ
jgi:hypothetical protein